MPLSSSDHCSLWFKVQDGNYNPRNQYFKFLGAWLDHSDFKNQVRLSWSPSNSWLDNINCLTDNLKTWNKEVFGHIFKRKQRILKRLEGIKKVLMSNSNQRLINLRDDLWNEYNMIISHEDCYWFQQARAN